MENIFGNSKIGSIFAIPIKGIRGVAQLASASGLGPEGPVFESQYPDLKRLTIQVSLFFLLPGATVSKISVAEPLNCRVSVQISAISVAGPTNCRVSVQISAISVDLGRPIGAFRPSWHLAGFPILPFGAKRGSAAPGSLDQGFPELRIEGASKPASAGRPSRVFDDRQGGKYGKAERPRG